MAVDKKSFILYSDLIHTVNKMPSDKAGDLFKHILSYVNDEEPETDDLIIQLTFEPIKQQLKRDLVTYEKKRAQWSEAGKRSAEARKANKKERTLTDVETRSTDSTVNVNDTVNVSVNVNDNVNKTILDRRSEFKNSLRPFLDQYDKDLINNFFEYWSEHGSNDRKMRFEKEKSFGISRRLSTWHKRQKSYEKEKNVAPKKENAGIALQRQMGLIP